MKVYEIFLNSILVCKDVNFSCKICKDFVSKRHFLNFKTGLFSNKYDLWQSKDNDILTLFIEGEDSQKFLFEKDRFWLENEEEYDDCESKPIKDAFLEFYPEAKDIVVDLKNNYLIASVNNEIISIEYIQTGKNFLFKEKVEVSQDVDSELENFGNEEDSNCETFVCLKENCPYNESTKCCYFKRINDHEDISPLCQNPFEYMEISRENPKLAEFL